MDFIAHLFWSAIIFAGPQIYWAILVGAIPDFIPFGSFLLYRLFQSVKQKSVTDSSNRTTVDKTISHLELLQTPSNQWVYRVYNYTHSLVIWAIVTGIIFFLGLWLGFTPWFMFAWLVHIMMDIPTHTKSFFAPQFLTPVSKIRVNGISWAHPLIMIGNYLGIGILFWWRLRQFDLI